MGAFDDSANSELGTARNRLAAWVEPLPAGELIDAASGLTENDLAVILRHLYATRMVGDPVSETSRDATHANRASVPITVRK